MKGRIEMQYREMENVAVGGVEGRLAVRRQTLNIGLEGSMGGAPAGG